MNVTPVGTNGGTAKSLPLTSTERSRLSRRRKRDAAAAVAGVAPAAPTVAPPPQRRVALGNTVLGVALAATGIVLAAVGMSATISYAVKIAAGPDRLLLAVLAAAADVLALLLPSAAVGLWRARRRLVAIGACVLWLVAAVTTLSNLAGFANTSADAFASARETKATERALVLDRVARLRSERAAIMERRPVGAIVVAIGDVPRSRIAAERQALATAKRRDQIDAELVGLEHMVETLPAVTAADPSAAGLAGVVALVTGGHVTVAQDALRRIRLALVLVLPLTGGLVLAIGLAAAARPASARRSATLSVT
jgi:hypothetical protein